MGVGTQSDVTQQRDQVLGARCLGRDQREGKTHTSQACCLTGRPYVIKTSFLVA